MKSKFFADTRGNAGLLFAVTVTCLLVGVGAAVDFSGAANLRSSYQDMADAAVLAAARAKPKEQSVMASIASDTVAELNDTGTTPTVRTVLSSDRKTLTVDLQGAHRNQFMSMFGKSESGVSTTAETLIEINSDVEITLVLDTTGSMGRLGRIDGLKRAGNTFLDVIDTVDAGDRLRVSVVPFGQYVNVGLSQRREKWIKVPADWTETFPQTCSMQRGPVTGQNCRDGVTSPQPGQPAQAPQPARPATYGTCTDDGVSYRCETSPAQPARPGQSATPATSGGEPTRICENIYGPDVRVCTTPPPIRHEWKGCVGSRRNNFNIDVDYSTGEAKVPGFLDLECGSEILPMTANLSSVRRKINGLNTYGETYSPAGLIWGHRMVNPNPPFAFNRTTSNGRAPRRVVIFMTDGFNTKSRTGKLHDGNERNRADRVSQKICDSMRDDRTIEVYTVSFQVSDNRAKRLVRNCATEDDMYYDASDSASLNTAFEDIAFSLLTPRLTR